MIKIIILAAGKGTRMKSSTPKVLHNIAEIPILQHVLEETKNIDQNCEVMLVISEALKNYSEFQQLQQQYKFSYVIQEQQNGTGHAVLCALAKIDFAKYTDVIVTCADTPLITKDTFKQLIAKHNAEKSYATCVCFEAENAFGYGRVILNDLGKIEQIIEQKNLTAEYADVTLCNSGVMMLQTQGLPEFLGEIEPNQISGELQLTDIYQISYKHNKSCNVVYASATEVLGINDQAQRAKVEELMQQKIVAKLMLTGVYIIKPDTSYFAANVEIGTGTTVYPNVYMGVGTKIADNVEIHSFSWLKECSIGPKNSIGPFARIRPGTKTGVGVKIGNFVEVKNAEIEANSKASHLAYIGDATIKENVNIGAGAIFCNYDGKKKHHSTVEKNSFIGSNSCIVSPVHVAEGSLVAAGSVITKNTEKNKIAITRSPQKNLPKKG